MVRSCEEGTENEIRKNNKFLEKMLKEHPVYICLLMVQPYIADLRHVCQSVRPHGITLLPMDGF
jgi:hypothetical protein